ncbi:MAG: hypothetical protein JNK15_03000 [Planctomycetes bacterium]|nr:hypothetical protein [Planctomycetota bacterium]
MNLLVLQKLLQSLKVGGVVVREGTKVVTAAVDAQLEALLLTPKGRELRDAAVRWPRGEAATGTEIWDHLMACDLDQRIELMRGSVGVFVVEASFLRKARKSALEGRMIELALVATTPPHTIFGGKDRRLADLLKFILENGVDLGKSINELPGYLRALFDEAEAYKARSIAAEKSAQDANRSTLDLLAKAIALRDAIELLTRQAQGGVS